MQMLFAGFPELSRQQVQDSDVMFALRYGKTKLRLKVIRLVLSTGLSLACAFASPLKTVTAWQTHVFPMALFESTPSEASS